MRSRWIRNLAVMALGLSVASSSVFAQGPQGWNQESSRSMRLEPVRGTVSFFYRTNELVGDSGFMSFGPQFQLDGSLGNRFVYSANFAYNRTERISADSEVTDAGNAEILGGARLGFRVGRKSFFELEYSNDGFDLGRDSVLFLNNQQQSGLGGIERGKSFVVAVRNETQIGTVARLSSSLRYTDYSTMHLSANPTEPLLNLLPDSLRRLEVREHALGQFELVGLHQLETGVRFILDQIGIGTSGVDFDGTLEDSTQLRATSVGMFLQDRWHLVRGWNLHMGAAYEVPGAIEVPERSELSVGISRNAPAGAVQYGANTFVRNGYPQLADYGSNGPSVELSRRHDSAYLDQLGLGGASVANYGGVELFLSKQLIQSLGFFLSYSFSHLRDSNVPQASDVAFGTVEADVPSLAMSINPPVDRNPLWEQTHMVHLATSFRVGQSLQLGSSINYLYAQPLDFVTAEVTLTSPHNVSVDMHVEKTLAVGDSQIGIMLDVFNLMEAGNLVAHDTAYDLDLATISGRRLQFGMRYGF